MPKLMHFSKNNAEGIFIARKVYIKRSITLQLKKLILKSEAYVQKKIKRLEQKLMKQKIEKQYKNQ